MSGATTAGRRRLALGAAGLALLVLAAAGAWWWGRREPPPAPPDVALSGADPDVAAAVRAARDRVRQEPASADAWGELGEVLLANGFPAEADVCLARAEARDAAEPRWPFLRAWGMLGRDPEAGVAALRRAVERTDRAPRADAEPYLLLADVSMQRGDRAEAEALCRRALGREPDNARAHFLLGLIALERDDVDGCLPDLLRAAASPSLRRVACAQLAVAYQRRGDEAAAAGWDRRAEQAADAPSPEPYLAELQSHAAGRLTRYGLAADLEAQGRAPEATALLRQMTEDDPSDGRAFHELGVLLIRMDRLADAEQAFRAAVRLDARSADASYDLAVALYMQGERLRAADDAGAAGRFEAAADAARTAAELKPDHAQAHLFLGLALEQLGRRPAALESFRAAERCRPEDPKIHMALGEALAKDGRDAEAAAQLRRACELAPDDPHYREALARVEARKKE